MRKSQTELLEVKTMAIEIKTSTENETQPNGKLVNGKIQINSPKCNGEKRV